MGLRLDAPTGIGQRQSMPSGILQIVWKDANNCVFIDTSAVVWRDRMINLFERTASIGGLGERQSKPVDGATKLSRPSGVLVKQDAPA